MRRWDRSHSCGSWSLSSEIARSPRLRITRPPSPLTSTKPQMTSRGPPHGKCDEPRSPIAEVHRTWLTRASADHTHRHWESHFQFGTSQSVSRGPTASSVGRYLARLWFLKPLPIPPRHVPADTGVQLPVLSSRGQPEHSSGANLLTFQDPDWFCMSPTPCRLESWKKKPEPAGRRSPTRPRNTHPRNVRHVNPRHVSPTSRATYTRTKR